MKKILVIVNEYTPHHSPNSSCLEAVLERLKDNYEIHILTARISLEDQEEQIIDNIRVFRADDYYSRLYQYFVVPPQKKGLLYKVKRNIFRIINKLFVEFFWPDITTGWVRRATKIAGGLYQKYEYDAVITSSGSFSTQLVGLKLKSRWPKWYWLSYYNDPLPINNHLYSNRKFSLLYNKGVISKRVLEHSDSIALETKLFGRYASIFPEFSNKLFAIGIPLLTNMRGKKEIKKETKKLNQKSTRFVFSGSINRKIRDPEYLLALLAQEQYGNESELHIYGRNDCPDIFLKYSDEFKGRLILHDYVSRQESLEAICNSDILVNIGNSVAHQVPSKIFEYMSFGLPILHVYSIDNDSCLEYLEKYGNSLCIKVDYSLLKENALKLKEFCLEKKGVRINFSDLETLFYENTPQNAANKIMSSLEASATGILD